MIEAAQLNQWFRAIRKIQSKPSSRSESDIQNRCVSPEIETIMSELKPDLESDLEYSMNSTNVDPKNMQEFTIYVSVTMKGIRPIRTLIKSSIAGSEPTTERPRQIPDHVGSNNLPHR